MKKIVFIMSLFSMYIVVAQDHVIPLYEGEIPNSKVSNLQETKTYSSILTIGKVVKPTIEVYLPAKESSTGIAVLICPGGGYSILAYDKEGTDIAKWLNGYGIAGIVLKYRLPEVESNEKPYLSPLMDAKRGMQIIRSHAKEWGLETNKIGVLGFSAGGHLASTLGTHFEDANHPDFMALLYPVITMKKVYTHQGSRKNLLGDNPSEKLVDEYCNELHVTENTPPTFIVHCEDDDIVPVENSLQFFKALKDHKISTELHVYPKGGHGYGMALKQGRLSHWSTLFITWLQNL